MKTKSLNLLIIYLMLGAVWLTLLNTKLVYADEPPRCFTTGIADVETAETTCPDEFGNPPVPADQVLSEGKCYEIWNTTGGERGGSLTIKYWNARELPCEEAEALTPVPGGDSTPGFTTIEERNKALEGKLTECKDKFGNVTYVSINVGCVETSDNVILGYLGGIINFLAVGVGLIVISMLGIAGIQYITAAGNPQRIEQAKTRAINAIMAYGTFLFIYAILQWLIPGGIF